MESVDVAIVGGGMVGVGVGWGLEGRGLGVGVVEEGVEEGVGGNGGGEVGVWGMNGGREKLVRGVGVWEEIVCGRGSCYEGMEVWEKESFGEIWFEDERMGYRDVGDMVEK